MLLIFIDQLTKNLAENKFLNFQFAFSLPVGAGVMFFLYALILVLILNYCLKHYSQFTKIEWLAWLAIFAGALSNIIERIVLGYVRDWIYILNGVLNLADFYIIAGVIILLVYNKPK